MKDLYLKKVFQIIRAAIQSTRRLAAAITRNHLSHLPHLLVNLNLNFGKKIFNLGSDVASTSRDSLPVVDAMSVYEDPFVAVTSDGNLYVKFYYEFNPRAEFRFGDIHHPFVVSSIWKTQTILFPEEIVKGHQNFSPAWYELRHSLRFEQQWDM